MMALLSSETTRLSACPSVLSLLAATLAIDLNRAQKALRDDGYIKAREMLCYCCCCCCCCFQKLSLASSLLILSPLRLLPPLRNNNAL